MTTIVTRAGKGSPLTNNEVDTNFTNLNSAKIETLTSTDSSVTITGTGDSRNLSVPVNPNVVSGPASATDNAITRFDGTTGKLVQNSTVTLDDNGNVINANSLGFDTTPATVPTTVGTMSWDDGDGVPIVALKGGNVNLQVGTQELARVYNDSGVTITKGQVVYISGAQGNRVAVKLARANVEATSFGTIGLVAETMTSGAEGFIIVSGALYKLDTSGLIAGATVYLSPTTAGAVTTTKPQAPDQLVVVGWVERVHNTVGSIYVKIDNGYELDELHDVRITSPQSGNVLIYDATTSPIGVWKNANLTDGTGISITEGAGSITIANTGVTQATAGTGISVSAGTGNVTITNTAPDQTVALTAGTGISTSGTYPNFTITNSDRGSSQNIFKNVAVSGQSTVVADTNDDTLTLVNGTGISITTNATTDAITITNTGVTSVSGTSPVSSSGGATPAISLASGYGDTQNPYASKTANFFLAAPNGTAGVPTFRAIVAADIPTLNQNTTGTASNVTGTVAIANGGTGATSAATALTNLGAYPATNPNGYTSNTGTVTSVSGTGTVSGLTLSGTVTTSGSLTLGGTLSAVTSAVAGTGISVSGSTGAVTFTNTGVTSVTAGSGISVSASTGGVTITNTSTGATITDDTSTNATRYILFDDATSGTLSSVNTSSTKLTYNPSTGTASATVFSATSDERLKDEITIITDALAKIKQLRGINYKWKDSGLAGTGLSAQDVQRVIPEAVVVAPNGDLSVAYGNLLGLLVEGMKDLAVQVEELKSKVGK